MPKKHGLRTLLDYQKVRGFETLLRYAQQFLCHIFWSYWKEISYENSVLVVSEMMRLFINLLTPDDKYSLSVKACV